MKKSLLFLTLATLLSGCIIDPSKWKEETQENQEEQTEQEESEAKFDIRQKILTEERNKLPLFLQEHNTVHSVVIDSVVITSTSFPAEGYLVTVWDFDEKQDLSTAQWAANGYEDKYVRKTKTVLVRVSGISQFLGKYDWHSWWSEAYYQVQDNRRR